MSFKIEFRAAQNPRAIRAADDDVVLGLKFLHAHLRISLAMVARFLVGKVGSEIVDFESGVGVLPFLGATAEQARLRALEVKIVYLIGAGLDLLDARP